MDMRDQDESSNVEDVRGSSGGGFQFRPVHGIGLGTLAIALIGGWALGINPLQMLGLLSGGNVGAPQSTPVQQTAPQSADQSPDSSAAGGSADQVRLADPAQHRGGVDRHLQTDGPQL